MNKHNDKITNDQDRENWYREEDEKRHIDNNVRVATKAGKSFSMSDEYPYRRPEMRDEDMLFCKACQTYYDREEAFKIQWVGWQTRCKFCAE